VYVNIETDGARHADLLPDLELKKLPQNHTVLPGDIQLFDPEYSDSTQRKPHSSGPSQRDPDPDGGQITDELHAVPLVGRFASAHDRASTFAAPPEANAEPGPATKSARPGSDTSIDPLQDDTRESAAVIFARQTSLLTSVLGGNNSYSGSGSVIPEGLRPKRKRTSTMKAKALMK